MDRFSGIANINQRYANSKFNTAIANSVLPITMQQPQGLPFNNTNYAYSRNQYPDQINNSALPISISEAQREIANPYNQISRMTIPQAAHQSRLGEIMYDASTKNKQKRIQPSLDKTPGYLNWIMPGVLIIILMIFVISCIVKHQNRPFSANSLKYYLQHPEQINNSKLNDAIILASLDENNLQSFNKSPISDEHISGKEEPLIDGTCREGLYYLNGMCYPCKVGYWNGTRCVVDNKNSDSQINQTTTTTTTVTKISNIQPNTNNTNQLDSPNNNSLITNDIKTDNINYEGQERRMLAKSPNQISQCKDGQFLYNGRCISCPLDTLWNGKYCQSIGHSQGSKYYQHLRRKL